MNFMGRLSPSGDKFSLAPKRFLPEFGLGQLVNFDPLRKRTAKKQV